MQTFEAQKKRSRFQGFSFLDVKSALRTSPERKQFADFHPGDFVGALAQSAVAEDIVAPDDERQPGMAFIAG